MINTQELLEKHNIRLNTFLDQHFLMDEKAIEELIRAAQLTKQDIVIEIGAGTGNITKILAEHVKKVIALELDERFKPILQTLPANVEIHYEDGIEFLKKNLIGNKIIANIPYQLAEPLLRLLCTAHHIECICLVVPKSFAENILKHSIFSSFFDAKIMHEVPKKAFYPEPDTNSVIVRITPKHDALSYIPQQLYLQRDKKLKNALREMLISYHKLHKKDITKNNARELIEKMNIEEEKLNTRIVLISEEIFSEITRKVKDVL
jgi:16S rRNA (adenine1518-N6/adenine1519-N6)-dimethyltransferase